MEKAVGSLKRQAATADAIGIRDPMAAWRRCWRAKRPRELDAEAERVVKDTEALTAKSCSTRTAIPRTQAGEQDRLDISGFTHGCGTRQNQTRLTPRRWKWTRRDNRMVLTSRARKNWMGANTQMRKEHDAGYARRAECDSRAGAGAGVILSSEEGRTDARAERN